VSPEEANQVPIIAEARTGPSWGQMEKIEGKE
jgi:hypothetical protein